MLSASVYCVYPRNVNSSNKPTKTKKTAQNSPTQKLFAMQRNVSKGIPAKGGDQANQY